MRDKEIGAEDKESIHSALTTEIFLNTIAQNNTVEHSAITLRYMATQTPIVYKEIAFSLDEDEISNIEITLIPLEIIGQEQQD